MRSAPLFLLLTLACTLAESGDSAAPSLPSEAGDTACTDLLDNDDDGLADCNDPGCASALACQGGEGSDALCADGGDNDLDGLVDCDDPDCAATVPCLFEDTDARCADGTDNDADGFIDCDDPDCTPTAPCLFEDTDTRCADGTDNDADGLIDCEDPDCAAVTPCLREDDDTLCADGADNDGDGLIDCDDTDCVTAFVCQEELCTPYNEDDGLAPLGLVDLDAEGDIRLPSEGVGASGDITGDGHVELLLVGIDGLQLYTGPFDCDFRENDPRVIASIITSSGFFADMGDIGDLNNDGYDDIAWSVFLPTFAGDIGNVTVFLGPIEGEVGLSSADNIVEGSFDASANSTSMGDSDGDGSDDLLIGAPFTAGFGLSSGVVYLLDDPMSAHSVADATTTIMGRGWGEAFGSFVSLHGDLDSDGLADLVGASSGNGGCIAVFRNPGPGTWSEQDADALLCGTDASYLTYGVVSGADLNGDGHDDLVAHIEPGPSCWESTQVHLGPITDEEGFQTTSAEFCGTQSDSFFGRSVIAEQDVDADGRDDVALGAQNDDQLGDERRGLVRLFYGPVSGTLLDTDADATFHSNDEIVAFGFSLAPIGDVNVDGYGDLFFPAGAYRDVSYLVFGGAR